VRWSRGTSKNGTIPRQPSGFAGCRFGGGPVVGSEMCLSIIRMALTNGLVLAILGCRMSSSSNECKTVEDTGGGAHRTARRTRSILFLSDKNG